MHTGANRLSGENAAKLKVNTRACRRKKGCLKQPFANAWKEKSAPHGPKHLARKATNSSRRIGANGFFFFADAYKQRI